MQIRTGATMQAGQDTPILVLPAVVTVLSTTHLGCRQVIIPGRQVSEGLLQGLLRLPVLSLETRKLILEGLERGCMYCLGLKYDRMEMR